MPQDGPCSIRVIEEAVTPRACPARPKRAQILNSSIYASLQQGYLENRVGNGRRNRQGLELSWSSSSRVRNTSLQII
ncbi:hypothetical protein P692DRAFT_20747832 [Suillus brevipes Sb2]|nr:hypothetical protein P692DRAFT_20747832 [Suillus brevipes Sb2]